MFRSVQIILFLFCLMMVACSDNVGDSASTVCSSCGGLASTPSLQATYSQSFMLSLRDQIDAIDESGINGNVSDSSTTADDTYLANHGIGADFAVEQYRVDYTTITPAGTTVQASAKVLVPSSVGVAMDMIVFGHGTSLRSAPTQLIIDASQGGFSYDGSVTNWGFYNEHLLAVVAANGYVVVQPNYLGLDDEYTDLHPQEHRSSLATAVIDAIRATKNFASEENSSFSLTGGFVLGGYSEGGGAAMAAHKALISDRIEYADISISDILAVIPGDANEDLSVAAADDAFNTANHPNPAGLMFQFLAYNQIYGYVSDPKTVFQSAYQSQVDLFFDGSTTLSTINSNLATLLGGAANSNMFTSEHSSEALAAISDYSSDRILSTSTSLGFYEDIIENDIYNYDPGSSTPYYIIQLQLDNFVPSSGATTTYDYMTSTGSAVPISGSTGNIAIYDPHQYVTNGGTSSNFSDGNYVDHINGIYFYIIALFDLVEDL